MPEMKAYCCGYDDEWVTYVHAETRGKAKARFMRIDPSGDQDFTAARLHRVPEWDNRPFVRGDEYNHLFHCDGYNDQGDPVYDVDLWVDCNCPLCKGAR